MAGTFRDACVVLLIIPSSSIDGTWRMASYSLPYPALQLPSRMKHRGYIFILSRIASGSLPDRDPSELNTFRSWKWPNGRGQQTLI